MKKALLLFLMMTLGSVAFGEGAEGRAAMVKTIQNLAEQGDVFAQIKIGYMYDTGEGAPQDYKEAAKWFEKAAEQGNTKAQYFIGFYYYYGKGVSRDYDKAAKWLHKAAEQRHENAQSLLGAIYSRGDGVPQDTAEAYFWFNLAAAQDPEFGPFRDEAASKLTPATLEKVQARCKKWLDDFEKRKADAGKN